MRSSRAGLRSRLLPDARWAKVVLLLIVLFAVLRSVVWASAQPGWVASDEDYHWHYVQYLRTQKALPDLDEPFGTAELYLSVQIINSGGEYKSGPRRTYAGPEHGALDRMERLGGQTREPVGEPPRSVLHPPLYYAGPFVADRLVTYRSAVTRLTVMRYYSALVGGLGVLLAWLLAAQVLSRTWQQLAAAALVATQPIVAFAASTLTNDVLALAATTATLAWAVRLLRVRPRARDGLVLGVVLGLALLTKATLLALAPVLALVLALVWRTHPGSGRTVARMAAGTVGATVLVSGAWYVHMLSETGSIFGTRGGTGPPPPGAGLELRPLSEAPGFALEWLSNVYRGYWFNYLTYEVTQRDLWYFLPLAFGALAAVGLGVVAVRRRRTLLDPANPALRQALVLLAAILALTLPPLLTDVRRALSGLPMAFQLGRFIVPTFPAAAILFLLALEALAGRRARLLAVATGATVVVGFVFYWQNWVRWCLDRFYGPGDPGWFAQLERAAFDKPEWVGPHFFLTLLALCLLTAVGAFAITVLASRRSGPPATPPAHPGPRGARRAGPAPRPAVRG